jgi:hypothetical protein
MAKAIAIYARDDAQLRAFILEFGKRGLVEETSSDRLVYNYRDVSGVTVKIPIEVEITGDIAPPSKKRIITEPERVVA